MRVLFIDVNCQKSSTGKIVYDLYKQLINDNHVAAICYGRGDIVEGDNIFKFGLDFETNIHALLARVTGLNGYFSPFSTKRLIKFIDEFNPDVIHIHELHAYFVNLKPLLNYIKQKKIKIVWTFHCEYMYTGKCGHAYECEKWKKNCGKCPAVKEYPKSLFLDFTRKMLIDKKKLLSNLDFTIVTPSTWLAERVEMSFLKNKDVKVIHNGIEADTIFYPKNQEEIMLLKSRYGLENKKIVLSVAPNIMSEAKGGNTVLEISKKIKDKNIYFVLVGANRDEKINENVTLIKKTTNQEELALWYSAADVFLICSKRENFPTTCLEAMCCGTPVVGFDVGGTKETVPEPYGLFLESEDIGALIKALYQQLLLKNQSKNIHIMGYKLYNKKVMYHSYLELYKK